MFTGEMQRAILETLAYSDVFDYPLRLTELHRYLPVRMSVDQALHTIIQMGRSVGVKDDLYFLPGREEIISIRRESETRSRALLPRALQYGRVLGALPFVRMVALTGSLAVMNVSRGADFDYMLVTEPGRLWTARAFAVTFNRLTRLRGHTLCPNLIVSADALHWPLHDLYSARELYQMKLITGRSVYQRLLKANAWAEVFLPNANPDWNGVQSEGLSMLQRWLETPLRGGLGDRFERWEMKRKITRFSMQPGFGAETVFNAQVCQGNFHHHRRGTQDLLAERLLAIAEGRLLQ